MEGKNAVIGNLQTDMLFQLTSLCLAMSYNEQTGMKRILCLHGKFQSGESFYNKIGGARRKLQQRYDLHFLDAPIKLESNSDETRQLAWWLKRDDGTHIHVAEAFDYVIRETKGQSYDALLGFSQGGVLASTLAISGIIPGIKAVITAGSPMMPEPYDYALHLAGNERDVVEKGLAIPKLHIAGRNDEIVPHESSRLLCEACGNGELLLHDKGHLFPTKAVHVNYMRSFLDRHIDFG